MGSGTPKQKRIKVGLIGCGMIAPRHFESIENIPQLELRAVCDIREERARKWAEKYKIPWHKNYKNLVRQDDIDLVSICTPNGLHAEMGIETARNGKHALIEKPLAINSREVNLLIDSFKKNKKKLFVVHQVRFNPAVLALKKALDKNRLGRINTANVTIYWIRPQAYFDQSEWRGTEKMDGGCLLTQGIHYIDILQWFLGPVESVFAKIDTVAHKIEIEDIASAILKFKKGTYATIEFTVCAYPKNLECSITLLGDRGSVKLGGTAVNEIELWEVENYPRPKIKQGLKPNVYAGGLYQGSCPNHIYIYQNIVNNFLEAEPIAIGGEEAKKSIEIIEAIYESSRKNKEVVLKKKY